MIISDLNYLEVASEAFSVVGGTGKKGKGNGKGNDKDKDKDNGKGNGKTVTISINKITQVANVVSIAKTKHGDATSAVAVEQKAKID